MADEVCLNIWLNDRQYFTDLTTCPSSHRRPSWASSRRLVHTLHRPSAPLLLAPLRPRAPCTDHHRSPSSPPSCRFARTLHRPSPPRLLASFVPLRPRPTPPITAAPPRLPRAASSASCTAYHRHAPRIAPCLSIALPIFDHYVDSNLYPAYPNTSCRKRSAC
jgi:hypothetical protein